MVVAQSQRSVIRSTRKIRKVTKNTKKRRKRRSTVDIDQARLVRTEKAITGEGHGQTRVKVSQVKIEKEERIAADDEDLAQEVDQVRIISSDLRLVDLTITVAQPCFRIIAIVDKCQKLAKINRNLVKAWDLIWPFMEIDSIKSRKWTNLGETRLKMVAKKSFRKTKRRLD